MNVILLFIKDFLLCQYLLLFGKIQENIPNFFVFLHHILHNIPTVFSIIQVILGTKTFYSTYSVYLICESCMQPSLLDLPTVEA